MRNLIEYISDVLPTEIGKGDRKVDKEKEATLAMLIANACTAENFRYGNGYIMGYDGKAYVLYTDKDIESMIVGVLERCEVGGVYVVNSVPAIRKHVERKIIKPYRPKKSIISFDNVVLDMDTCEIFSHAEKFETNIRMLYDYDPKAKCERFMKYLYEVLINEDTIMTLQEFCGALFVDRRKFKIENVLYLLGTGQNGKSVFTETLTYMLGAQNTTSFSIEKLTRAMDKNYNIAAMNGKLANICNDMSKGDISGGDFKTIVSGEPIMARHAYGRPFNATELPLIIANVNEMPVTTDHTLGHHRRPLPIPFNITISNDIKDVMLPMKLRSEVSGIFNWILEGRQRFIRNNGRFTEGMEIKKEREKIRLESNSVLQFMHEKQYLPANSPGALEIWITVEELYRAYENFCKDYGKKNAFEKTNMGRILQGEGYVQTRKKSGRGYVIYLGGDSFKDDEPVSDVDELGLFADSYGGHDLPF